MIDKAVKNLFDPIVDEKLQLSVVQHVVTTPSTFPSVHEAEQAFVVVVIESKVVDVFWQ